jgi:hypothetical protein
LRNFTQAATLTQNAHIVKCKLLALFSPLKPRTISPVRGYFFPAASSLAIDHCESAIYPEIATATAQNTWNPITS